MTEQEAVEAGPYFWRPALGGVLRGAPVSSCVRHDAHERHLTFHDESSVLLDDVRDECESVSASEELEPVSCGGSSQTLSLYQESIR